MSGWELFFLLLAIAFGVILGAVNAICRARLRWFLFKYFINHRTKDHSTESNSEKNHPNPKKRLIGSWAQRNTYAHDNVWKDHKSNANKKCQNIAHKILR